APRTARLADRLENAAALVVARLVERLPPARELRIGFADDAAQAQEVEPGAKARLLEQGQRRVAGAPLEAGLQHPDLAHVDRQLAAPRDVADASVEGGVDGALQRRERRFAGVLALLPAVEHVVPQH